MTTRRTLGSGPLARAITLGTGILLMLTVPVLIDGCYKPTRGDPVDAFHYEHEIKVARDLTHVIVQTYVNRTHLQVGIHREDLFDGDRDGNLQTPGLDRIEIADYDKIDASLESAVRSTGELANYDELFRNILAAAKAGRKTFRIESRNYRVSLFSENAPSAQPNALG